MLCADSSCVKEKLEVPALLNGIFLLWSNNLVSLWDKVWTSHLCKVQFTLV